MSATDVSRHHIERVIAEHKQPDFIALRNPIRKIKWRHNPDPAVVGYVRNAVFDFNDRGKPGTIPKIIKKIRVLHKVHLNRGQVLTILNIF